MPETEALKYPQLSTIVEAQHRDMKSFERLQLNNMCFRTVTATIRHVHRVADISKAMQIHCKKSRHSFPLE